jgi:hypothetical protein
VANTVVFDVLRVYIMLAVNIPKARCLDFSGDGRRSPSDPEDDDGEFQAGE